MKYLALTCFLCHFVRGFVLLKGFVLNATDEIFSAHLFLVPLCPWICIAERVFVLNLLVLNCLIGHTVCGIVYWGYIVEEFVLNI